jgi:hypothetical protein
MLATSRQHQVKVEAKQLEISKAKKGPSKAGERILLSSAVSVFEA